VIFPATKLAIILAGNRLIVAAIRRQRAETFVVEAEQPAAALRAELDARRLAPRTVALGLPRAVVTVKPIDFPLVSGVTREMVRFELERHVPFPADDAAFDFSVIPGDTNGAAAPGLRRVLVAGADRRVVEGALRIADEAKLKTTSVTVASHDLLGLVKLERKGRVVWIHKSALGIDLLFVASAHLVLSRSLPAASDEEIVSEIRQSLTVLRWRTVDAIWLSGESEYVSAAFAPLGSPVSAPPYTATARRLLAGLERDSESPRGLGELAIAVAARRGPRLLDVIPDGRRPRRITRAQWVTMGTLAATVILGVAALLYPGYRAGRYLVSVNRRIEALTPEVRAVERVQQELERKRRLLASIVAIEANSTRPLPILRELTEVIPSEAWLTSLSLDTKGVELTGQAAVASALIPVLENSPRLEKVEFSSPVTRGRDKEQFRIRASWEPQGRPVPSAPAPGGAMPAPSSRPRPGVPPSPGATGGGPR
jgi:Tfp pilus assembly protein PilN